MDHALDEGASPAIPAARVAPKRLNPFERYLSFRVGLCMVAGVLLGKATPSSMESLRRPEFGAGSQIDVPIAILIWLMITPMMKVDFGAIRDIGRRPRGLFVTLFVNWLVKPFSMAAIAWLFFRYLFSPWIAPADADQYIAGRCEQLLRAGGRDRDRALRPRVGRRPGHRGRGVDRGARDALGLRRLHPHAPLVPGACVRRVSRLSCRQETAEGRTKPRASFSFRIQANSTARRKRSGKTLPRPSE